MADAGDLLTCWRDEGVEYDFVRRDWLEENLVFELKSHPPLSSLASFSRRLVFTSRTPARCSPFANSDRSPAKRFWISAPRPAAKRRSSRN